MVCCFTGHRNIPAAHREAVILSLNRTLSRLAEKGCRVFNAGGALGFDTIAALAVLRVKRKYPDVVLNLYLPYPGQAEKWPAEDISIYNYIKQCADNVYYSSQEYTPYCMASRNRALVDNGDVCIAYCTQPSGGSAYTISYAMDSGLPVLNIANASSTEISEFLSQI